MIIYILYKYIFSYNMVAETDRRKFLAKSTFIRFLFQNVNSKYVYVARISVNIKLLYFLCIMSLFIY